MFTMALGILGLAISNFLKTNKYETPIATLMSTLSVFEGDTPRLAHGS